VSGNSRFSPHGILPVDKPAGPTSHDIVARVRRLTRAKTGHAGTLDPGATGVLVILLGAAVRLSDYYMRSDKEYLATIRLGMSSNTYDAQGELIPGGPVPPLGIPQVDRLLDEFRGTIEQTPPMFSAVKVAGVPLHKKARLGEEVERKSRLVTISELEVTGLQDDSLDLRIVCSSGTYVRSLAHELGRRLGCGAYLDSLRRARSGVFSADRALPYFKLETEWTQWMVPLEELLPELPRLDLDDEEGLRISHGNPVADRTDPGVAGSQDEVRLFWRGELIALGRREAGLIRAKAVLRPAK